MRLIMFIEIYVIKYQIIAHRGWVGAYSRGRLSNNLVSGVGTYSRVGAYSLGALNRSITVIEEQISCKGQSVSLVSTRAPQLEFAF